MSLSRKIQKPYPVTMRFDAGPPGRNLVLIMVAPSEHHEGREGTDEARSNHPPDVPDHGKAHHCGKEGANETGRRIAWKLDRLVVRLLRHTLVLGAPLHRPIGVFAGDIGH